MMNVPISRANSGMKAESEDTREWYEDMTIGGNGGNSAFSGGVAGIVFGL